MFKKKKLLAEHCLHSVSCFLLKAKFSFSFSLQLSKNSQLSININFYLNYLRFQMYYRIKLKSKQIKTKICKEKKWITGQLPAVKCSRLIRSHSLSQTWTSPAPLIFLHACNTHTLACNHMLSPYRHMHDTHN